MTLLLSRSFPPPLRWVFPLPRRRRVRLPFPIRHAIRVIGVLLPSPPLWLRQAVDRLHRCRRRPLAPKKSFPNLSNVNDGRYCSSSPMPTKKRQKKRRHRTRRKSLRHIPRRRRRHRLPRFFLCRRPINHSPSRLLPPLFPLRLPPPPLLHRMSHIGNGIVRHSGYTWRWAWLVRFRWMLYPFWGWGRRRGRNCWPMIPYAREGRPRSYAIGRLLVVWRGVGGGQWPKKKKKTILVPYR